MTRRGNRALVALVAAGLLASCGATDEPAAEASETSAEPTRLEAVHEICVGAKSFGEIGDDGMTLIMDGRGQDDPSMAMRDALEALGCVWDELEVPDSVRARMMSTRALDGSQSATWDNFEATWSYHPDSGMDMVITEAQP